MYKSQQLAPDPRSGLQLENLVQPFFPDFQVIHGGVGSLWPILSDRGVAMLQDSSTVPAKSQGKPWT